DDGLRSGAVRGQCGAIDCAEVAHNLLDIQPWGRLADDGAHGAPLVLQRTSEAAADITARSGDEYRAQAPDPIANGRTAAHTAAPALGPSRTRGPPPRTARRSRASGAATAPAGRGRR